MERNSIFPAFLHGRALSWVWAGCAVFALVYGFVSGGRGYEVIGAFGLIGVIIAFPLAHFMLNSPASEQADESGESAHDS